MCGRFGLFDGIDDLAWHFDVSPQELVGYAPRWNIAPTMPILTVGKENAVGVVRWGIPAGRGNGPLFNARSETVHRLPAFRDAFQQGTLPDTRQRVLRVAHAARWRQGSGMGSSRRREAHCIRRHHRRRPE